MRRRFFPATPVQQVPGRTVELEVQLRPAAPPAPPAAEEGCNCDVAYALAWPERLSPSGWELGSVDSAMDVLAFSVEGAGSFAFWMYWYEAMFLPFQVVNVLGNGRVPLPSGCSVEWVPDDGWPPETELPAVTFDPETGRGLVDASSPPDGVAGDFGLRIRLLRDGDEIGHLVLVRAEGVGGAPYPGASWIAWA